MSETNWYKAVNLEMPLRLAVSAMEWKQANSSALSLVLKPSETLVLTFNTLIEASLELLWCDTSSCSKKVKR